jgi:1-acyl-sn-glycerol-3-phosphate acyltransferase
MKQHERSYPLTVLLYSAAYLSYFLSKAAFIVCALPLVICLSPFPQTKARLLQAMTHRYLAFFTRTWLPALGAYRIVEIRGLERALAARPVICVANHRGFMDGILLLGLLPRTGVLIKARDTRQWTYALLERHLDLVSVDRNSLNSVSASLDRCRAVLAAGKNLLVFPEGTRSRSGRLQHFNRIAFQLALASRTPVLPVIVHSTCPFMAKVPGSIFPRGRNQYGIRFLDLESPRPDDDADAFCDRIHRRMAQELKTLDVGTCWEIPSQERIVDSREQVTESAR